MISEVLSQLILKIQTDKNPPPRIALANIATLLEGDDFQENSTIVLSLVNIEEDKTLKNNSLYKPNSTQSPSVDKYKNPTQNLIISILFSSYIKKQNLYDDGIDSLEDVIKYLQANNVFYFDENGLNASIAVENSSYYKIIIDLVSMKTEQLNQMWSYLGSKYMPSVLYTMRLIPIQSEDNLLTDKTIQKVKVKLWENDPSDTAGLLESSQDIEP
jgi:hypothetical protein